MKCIFCGGSQVSKEHIFAKWMKEFLPSEFPKTRHIATFNSRFASPTEPKITFRNGTPRSQKLRVVCEKCNNGWMSQLQQETKPILLPFLRGEWNELETETRVVLASWVTMFVMVIEFRDHDTIAASEGERSLFRSSRAPLNNWQVWIGHYDGKAGNSEFFHRGIGIGPNLNEIQNSVGIPNRCNTQFTIFAVGKVVFFCFSSTSVKVNAAEFGKVANFANTEGLTPIWPPFSHEPVAKHIVHNAHSFKRVIEAATFALLS